MEYADNSDGAEGDEKKPASTNKGLSLEDIQANGELIMLTVNGPTTYYEMCIRDSLSAGLCSISSTGGKSPSVR